MPGKDENHHFASLDGSRDFSRERPPGLHISRGDPATDGGMLKGGANRVSDRFVLRRMRNEDVVSHRNQMPFYLLLNQQARCC
jgi:hypothetical protein